MLGDLLEAIRTGVLTASGVPVDRSYVAGGPDFAVEGCTQLIVWLAQTRAQYAGTPGNPPIQGVGIPGAACGAAPVYDAGLAYYAGCYPTMQDENPPDVDEFAAFVPGYLDDVQAVHEALLGLSLPFQTQMTVGTGLPASPSPAAGVVGMRWPLSLFPTIGVEFGSGV